MGITAVVSGTAPSGLTLPSTTGLGVGSIFAAVALVYLLGYFDLFTAASWEDRQQRMVLLAAIIPLLLVFAGIVFFQAMRVIGGAF